jgi:hypothetical protein
LAAAFLGGAAFNLGFRGTFGAGPFIILLLESTAVFVTCSPDAVLDFFVAFGTLADDYPLFPAVSLALVAFPPLRDSIFAYRKDKRKKSHFIKPCCFQQHFLRRRLHH